MRTLVALIALVLLGFGVNVDSAVAALPSTVAPAYAYGRATTVEPVTGIAAERDPPGVHVVAGHLRPVPTIAVEPHETAAATTTYDGRTVAAQLTGALATAKAGERFEPFVPWPPGFDDVAANTAARACSFTGTTLVLMGDGSKKPIDEVKVGDEVLASDPETGEQEARKVTHVFVHQDTVTDLDLEDGPSSGPRRTTRSGRLPTAGSNERTSSPTARTS